MQGLANSRVIQDNIKRRREEDAEKDRVEAARIAEGEAWQREEFRLSRVRLASNAVAPMPAGADGGQDGAGASRNENDTYDDDDDDDDFDDEDLKIDRRQAIFLFFDDPGSSLGAKLASIFIMFCIILSSSTFVVETLPQYRRPIYKVENDPTSGEVDQADHYPELHAFAYIEIACIVVFTVEYVMRLLTVSSLPTPVDLRHLPASRAALTMTWRFVREPLNIVDLLAILPFYVELFAGGGGGLAVFRVLRLARVFRVFKLGKYSEGMQMFGRVLYKSADALYLLAFFVFIAVVLFGALIFFAEEGTYDRATGEYMRDNVVGSEQEVSPFTSIPDSFWWVVVTSTTVGYGDFVPTSLWGKVIGTVTMHLGILVLALPITVIGTHFAVEYELMNQKQGEAKERKRLAKLLAKSGLDIENLDASGHNLLGSGRNLLGSQSSLLGGKDLSRQMSARGRFEATAETGSQETHSTSRGPNETTGDEGTGPGTGTELSIVLPNGGASSHADDDDEYSGPETRSGHGSPNNHLQLQLNKSAPPTANSKPGAGRNPFADSSSHGNSSDAPPPPPPPPPARRGSTPSISLSPRDGGGQPASSGRAPAAHTRSSDGTERTGASTSHNSSYGTSHGASQQGTLPGHRRSRSGQSSDEFNMPPNRRSISGGSNSNAALSRPRSVEPVTGVGGGASAPSVSHVVSRPASRGPPAAAIGRAVPGVAPQGPAIGEIAVVKAGAADRVTCSCLCVCGHGEAAAIAAPTPTTPKPAGSRPTTAHSHQPTPALTPEQRELWTLRQWYMGLHSGFRYVDDQNLTVADEDAAAYAADSPATADA